MEDKLTDRNKSVLYLIILLIVYIIYTIVDGNLNYYEIRYTAAATVVSMYSEPIDGIFEKERYYLSVSYEDSYVGLVNVTKPTYNTIDIGDIILVRVYEKYRKIDGTNIECRLTFDSVLEDV